MPIKLNTASGGGVILQGANTASDKTITIPADDGTMIYSNSSGNVGIGTSSPTTIAGYQSLTVNGSTSGLISIKYNGTDGGYLYADSSSFNIDGKSATPNVVFKTNGAERLRIDSSGNVGIGTSSPVNKLNVVSSTGQVDNDGLIKAEYTGSTASVNAGVTVKNYSGTSQITQWENFGVRIGSRITTNGGAGNLVFTSGNDVERARIDSSGRLLLGTTTLASGMLNIRGYTNGGVYGVAMQPTADNATPFIFFNAAGTGVGTISTTASATSYVTTSDYRLKDNVQPMTGALAKVAALKPVTYTWKADGSAGEGFIAHELAEVCPDAVVGEKDAVNEDGSIKAQGIDTSFLVATLTAAIQELKAELDQLRAQVEAK